MAMPILKSFQQDLSLQASHITESPGTMTQMYGNKHQTMSQASEKAKQGRTSLRALANGQAIAGEGLREAVGERRWGGHASTWPQYTGECGGPAVEE